MDKKLLDLKTQVEHFGHYTALLENQLKDSESMRAKSAQLASMEQAKILRHKEHILTLETRILQQRDRIRVLEGSVVDRNARIKELEGALKEATTWLIDEGRSDIAGKLRLILSPAK